MLMLCKLRYVSATRASISGGIVPVCQRAAEWSDGVKIGLRDQSDWKCDPCVGDVHEFK